MSRTRKDARQLLEDLGLYKVPVDPIEVCEKLGFVYDERPYDGFDGTLISVGNNILVGVNSNLKEHGRKAFTCSHEIGHSVYDLDSATSFACTREDVGYGSKLNEIEIRANEFASELLLPADFFQKDIRTGDPSWDALQTLAKKFQASLQATANRFVQLSHHTCWLVVVKNGVIHRFTKASHNEFFPALKQSFKPPKSAPAGFQETRADFWLRDSKKIRNKKLWHWPLPQNQYGECPVLLWDRGNTLLDDYCGDEFDDELAWRDDDPKRSRW